MNFQKDYFQIIKDKRQKQKLQVYQLQLHVIIIIKRTSLKKKVNATC